MQRSDTLRLNTCGAAEHDAMMTNLQSDHLSLGLEIQWATNPVHALLPDVDLRFAKIREFVQERADLIDPSNGLVYAQVASGSTVDVDRAVAAPPWHSSSGQRFRSNSCSVASSRSTPALRVTTPGDMRMIGPRVSTKMPRSRRA